MNVFVYSTHTLWPHHAETELEIIQNHLNRGDTVYRFVCNGELPVCDTNPTHRLHACLRCVDKQVFGKGLLVGNEKIITRTLLEEKFSKQASEYNFDFTDLAIFKEQKIDAFDIGYAVCSSVISELRDPSPNIQENIHLFRNYFYSSLAIYFSVLENIETLKPDLIYAFNGRVAHAKPVLRAAQKMGIECRIHERGCDIFHYGITVNTTPHDIKYFNLQMQKKWEEGDLGTRELIGSSFYEERVQGKEQAWISYVKDQEKNLLPADWNASKHNIAIFNTSEDEYESIGPEWKNFLYATQAEGIEKILKSFLADDSYHFTLRIHPNLKGLDNKQIRDAFALSHYKNLTIIEAADPVDTYTLMKNCEKIITFGSSIGIEAAYWGKVSILLGKSFYYDLDVAYTPQTHTETITLISSDLKPKGKIDALKYGYYLKTFGTKFIYYKPTGLLSGTFNNVNLDEVAGIKTKLLENLYKISLFKYIYHHFKNLRYSIQNSLLKW